MKDETEAIIIRELTASDLGWFAALRDRGMVASKQRAINFNATVVSAVLPSKALKNGIVTVKATCVRQGAEATETRTLKKVHKNWRLGGHKVPGEVFVNLRPGDLFICRLVIGSEPPYEMQWSVIIKALDPDLWDSLSQDLKFHLSDRMALFNGKSNLLALFNALLISAVTPAPAQASPGADTDHQYPPSSPEKIALHDEKPPAPPPSEPLPKRERRKLTPNERLEHPHIAAEMMKACLSLSAAAQRDFLQVLKHLATSFRAWFEAAGAVQQIDIDHPSTWKSVAGKPIAFIDGGSANLVALGAAPIAVRVGSYVVTPGAVGDHRERFEVEKQLVAELYDTSAGQGLYDDIFEDPSKLNDAARMALEVAGALRCASTASPKPQYLFLHGSLVNPVSAYAQDKFPAFSSKGLEVLLPESERDQTGRDAKFVSVYLRLLQMLQARKLNVAGVVERASASQLVSGTLLDQLAESEFSPGAEHIAAARNRMREFRISDAMLFHAVLNEGEYFTPVAIDRNDLRRAPNESADLIAQYPKPKVTYVGVGEMALPIRVEFFDDPPAGYSACISLIVHSCRLMPDYAFPAGLDIVDKFAKVPNWMSRPVNTALAVQVLKRALATGDPGLIAGAKRMLCGTNRDWLFRPTFNS